MDVWYNTLQVTAGEWYIRVPKTLGGVEIALEFLKMVKELQKLNIK